MKPLAIILSLWLACPVWGQTPVKPPDVILPNPPTPIVPLPNPTNPLSITGQLYVVDATGPVVVLASPEGVVSITPQKGPMTIRDVFVGGSGQKEIRMFKGPNLYLVEAKGTGTCELIIVRSVDPALTTRQMLVSGTTPINPPDNPPDPLTVTFKAALVQDGAPIATAATLAKIYRTAAVQSSDPALATYADLMAKVAAAQDAAVPPLTIQNLRKAIASQIVSKLGTSGQAPIDRALAANMFNSLASALEGVK